MKDLIGIIPFVIYSLFNNLARVTHQSIKCNSTPRATSALYDSKEKAVCVYRLCCQVDSTVAIILQGHDHVCCNPWEDKAHLPYTPWQRMPSRDSVRSPKTEIIRSILYVNLNISSTQRREVLSGARKEVGEAELACIDRSPNTAAAPIRVLINLCSECVAP